MDDREIAEACGTQCFCPVPEVEVLPAPADKALVEAPDRLVPFPRDRHAPAVKVLNDHLGSLATTHAPVANNRRARLCGQIENETLEIDRLPSGLRVTNHFRGVPRRDQHVVVMEHEDPSSRVRDARVECRRAVVRSISAYLLVYVAHPWRQHPLRLSQLRLFDDDALDGRSLLRCNGSDRRQQMRKASGTAMPDQKRDIRNCRRCWRIGQTHRPCAERRFQKPPSSAWDEATVVDRRGPTPLATDRPSFDGDRLEAVVDQFPPVADEPFETKPVVNNRSEELARRHFDILRCRVIKLALNEAQQFHSNDARTFVRRRRFQLRLRSKGPWDPAAFPPRSPPQGRRCSACQCGGGRDVIQSAAMDSPLVSVIITVFNRPRMLREAVVSALAQSYRPLEILVVDDGSVDDTPKVCGELARDHPEIRALRRENGGPGAARETGRLAARGDFIQYLDSDDLLLPRKLELQVESLRAQPACGVAYGLTRYRDAAGDEIECRWKAANQRQTTMFPSFLVSRWWETGTPLYRRSVTDAAGPWTSLRLEEDWEYDCRVAALGTRLAFVDEMVLEHRDHTEGRLSRGHTADPARLRERARAHELIAASAARGTIAPETAEMQHFSRELFLLARQCGAAGLTEMSKSLFALARKTAGQQGGRLQFRGYAAAVRVLGWNNTGRLALLGDRMRHR